MTPTTTVAKPNGTHELTHWTPFQDTFALPTRMNQLLESMWHTMSHPDEAAPGAQLEETEDAFVLELDLPGVTKKNIQVDIAGRRLSVRADRTETAHPASVRRHTTRVSNSYAYDLSLPGDVDDTGVTAKLEGGVLTVRVPKSPTSKTTRVRID